MANSQTKITITHDQETTGDLVMKAITNYPTKSQVEHLANLLERVHSGVSNGKVQTTIDDGNAVAATGTVTFSGSSSANDTFVINGVTLTCVASGATNNQWNVGGGTATQQAAAFVAAVNSSSTSLVSGQVFASNLAGVVTFTSNFPGIAGNAVTIAKGTDAGSVMTVSGARLTGGLQPTNQTVGATYSFGL